MAELEDVVTAIGNTNSKLEEVNQSVIKLDNDFIFYRNNWNIQNLFLNEKLILFEENVVLQQENNIVMQEKFDNLQYQVDQAITFQTYNFVFFGVFAAIMIVMLLFKGFKIRG